MGDNELSVMKINIGAKGKQKNVEFFPDIKFGNKQSANINIFGETTQTNLPLPENNIKPTSIFEPAKTLDSTILEQTGWTGDNLEKDLEILDTLKKDGYDISFQKELLEKRITAQDSKGNKATEWLKSKHAEAYASVYAGAESTKEKTVQKTNDKKLTKNEVKNWTGNNLEKDLETLAGLSKQGYDISEYKAQLAKRIQVQEDKGTNPRACLEGKHAEAYMEVFSEYKNQPVKAEKAETKPEQQPIEPIEVKKEEPKVEQKVAEQTSDNTKAEEKKEVAPTKESTATESSNGVKKSGIRQIYNYTTSSGKHVQIDRIHTSIMSRLEISADAKLTESEMAEVQKYIDEMQNKNKGTQNKK